MEDKDINSTASAIEVCELVDICNVIIDQSLSVPEKKLSYLNQIKNPEFYRCGDTIIRVSYANTGVRLADRLKQYLLTMQSVTLT